MSKGEKTALLWKDPAYREHMRAVHSGGRRAKTRRVLAQGYVQVRVPGHPRAATGGWVHEHIVVMEASIGRYLADDEIVHHINRNPADNRIENLRLMARGDHTELHSRLAWEAGAFESRPVMERDPDTGRFASAGER